MNLSMTFTASGQDEVQNLLSRLAVAMNGDFTFGVDVTVDGPEPAVVFSPDEAADKPADEPASSAPESSDAAQPDPLAKAIAATGRTETASVGLKDGKRVSKGDEVTHVETGEVFVVEATVRGFVIAATEEGGLQTIAAALLTAAPGDTGSSAEGDAAPADDTGDEDDLDAELERAAAAQSLPDDHLLAELRSTGMTVKNTLGIAKVVELIAAVHAGAKRASDVPPEKRQALLDNMNAALSK